MADIEFKVEGLDELIKRNANLSRQYAPIVREFLDKTMYGFSAKAQHLAPVDTGLLRASLTKGKANNIWEIGGSPIPEWGMVGTRLNYAPSVEYGSRPHYAPIDRLQKWAKAHGLTAGQVWNAIWMRGTQPHPFFKPAFDWSKGDLEKNLEEAVRQIEEAWQ